MKHELYTVTAAEVVDRYTLRVEFSDGVVRIVNLEGVLEGELFGPLQDPELFRQVRVDSEARTVVWPNGADFDPATLHEWAEYADEWRSRAREWAKVAESHGSYGAR